MRWTEPNHLTTWIVCNLHVCYSWNGLTPATAETAQSNLDVHNVLIHLLVVSKVGAGTKKISVMQLPKCRYLTIERLRIGAVSRQLVDYGVQLCPQVLPHIACRTRRCMLWKLLIITNSISEIRVAVGSVDGIESQGTCARWHSTCSNVRHMKAVVDGFY